jgi:uncharacterized protein DUF3365
MKRSPRFVVLTTLSLACLGLVLSKEPAAAPALAEEKNGPSPAALERARESVKMLDDLYKTAVVSITNKYVEQQSDTPAAAIAKEVFEAMHKKGWHHARLVDATGKPRNKANLPKTDFEKKGAAAMKEGKGYIDEIGETNGVFVLRAATVVPAVLSQCTICHGGKQGRVLGAIIYELPIK